MNKFRQCSTSALLSLAMLSGIASLQPVEAQLGPCKTAAPTTPDVNLFVSDLDRAVDWYRKNAGLVEDSRWFDFGRGGITAVRLKREKAGVTLIFSPAHRELSSLQMLCLVLDNPPAPSAGSMPAYLIDPDGASVELVYAPATGHSKDQ